MSKYIDENKAYKMAKEIWGKHFRYIMPFDIYYHQIKPQLMIYFSLPPCIKPIYNRMLNNRTSMVYNQLQRIKIEK